MACAALAILLTSEIGVKAVLGTLGGGSLIAGIFLLIGALTLADHAKKNKGS